MQLLRIIFEKWDSHLSDLEKLEVWHALAENKLPADLFPKEWKRQYLDGLPSLYDAAIRLDDANVIIGGKWPSIRRNNPETSLHHSWNFEPYNKLKRDMLLAAMENPKIKPQYRILIAFGGYQESDELAARGHKIIESLSNFNELRKLISATEAALDGMKQKSNLAHAWLYGLESHPEWKLDLKEIFEIAKDDRYWRGVRDRTSIEAAYTSTQKTIELARDMLKEQNREIEIGALPEPEKGGLLGPSYEYDLPHSEKTQKHLVDNLRGSGRFPADPRAEHELFLALAGRGPSAFMDNWAEELYLGDRWLPASELREILERRVVWEPSLRKRIFDKLTRLDPVSPLPASHGRMAAIVDHVQLVNRYFPEDSLPKAQIIEAYANRINANHRETKVISSAKYSGNHDAEGVAVRVFSGLVLGLNVLDNGMGPVERTIRFIRFLQGKEPLHQEVIRGIVSYGSNSKDPIPFDDSRVLRQFRSLDPVSQALVMNPLLTDPYGLLNMPGGKKAAVELALESVGEYQGEARLLLESMLHALDKTAYYQKSLALVAILSQGGNAKIHPGERLGQILRSAGNTGISIGQKLYQRRLVPDDFLPYLEDLTDEARKPDRLTIFEMIARVLEHPDVDDILALEEKLVDASSNVVVKLRYRDGRIDSLDERALKILWENLEDQTKLEVEKLSYLIDYAEKNGGPQYRRLRSALESVSRGLLRQADARTETRNYERVSSLYRSGEVYPHSGVRFVVIKPDPKAGQSQNHTNEEVAKGVSLKKLATDDPDRAREIYQAIALKEREILRRAPEHGDDVVYFESDRHRGNYKVDLTGPEPVIYVFDYPLLSAISGKQLDALHKLMGFTGYVLQEKQLPRPVLREMVSTIVREMCEGECSASEAGLMSEVRAAVESHLKSSNVQLRWLLYDILGAAEVRGVTISPAVHDYLAALGNADFYSSAEEQVNLKTPLMHEVEQTVRERMMTVKIKPSLIDFCSEALRKLVH